MTSFFRPPAMRGHALIEAVLALAVVAGLVQGMAMVSALQMQGLQASQLGRHAAFAAARGQAEIPAWTRATISIGLSSYRDAHAQAGDAQAVVLARDWLRADPRLRVAQARVHAHRGQAFMRHDEPAAFLSVQRHTVLAENAGHADGAVATVQRLGLSPTGWSDAEQQSRAAAQALYRRMQPVDAPWGRGRWSTDWLAPWADLAPVAARH